MAVIIARQMMVIRREEGEHTIFPSERQQSLPDNLLDHEYVKDAIASRWITVVPVQAEVDSQQEQAPEPSPKKKRAS